MFPPFPQKEAFEICREMTESLENGSLILEKTSKISEERQGTGIMIGALVCLDENNKKVILKTSSGFTRKLKNLKADDSVYVPPIVSEKEIENALSKNDERIHVLTEMVNKESISQSEKENLLKERSFLTKESLVKVYDLYRFHCIDGKVRSLKEISGYDNERNLPPTGTGDCCAPKLLSYAFSKNLRCISLCEVFYEKGKKLYEPVSPCDERCSLILPSMLGLEIIYQDEDIVVVNKQSMLLSVPGRGPLKQDCIVNRLKKLFPSCIEQPSVHRLDLETSGVMVLALKKEAHRILSRQFEEGKVEKHYEALIDGILPKKGFAEEGVFELYFRLDVENRPHQIWDDINGKKAITEWKIKNIEKYKSVNGTVKNVTRVDFTPLTGRTHQLRLASSDSHGFGMPIEGDTLYGKCEEGERLMLHAYELSFYHPSSNKRMTFKTKVPF